MRTKSSQAVKPQIDNVVKIEVNSQINTWQIVAPGGSDIENGKISSDAPLAEVILDMSVGESRKVDIHGREMKIKVIQVLK